MIITISGVPGSGKTTLAKNLLGALKTHGFDEINVGAHIRGLAHKTGVSPEEYYERLEADPDLEKRIDQEMVGDVVAGRDNLIIQGRVAFHTTKNSPFRVVNIFLTLHPFQAVERLQNRDRTEGSEDDLLRQYHARIRTEQERYQSLYDIQDHHAHENFDIVMSTENLDPTAVCNRVLAEIALIVIREGWKPDVTI